MEQFKSMGNRLAIAAALPSESAPNNPVIEILGYRRVFLENHNGIAEYGAEKILVKVSYGKVCITGKSLQLAEMSKSSLVITGQIDCVSMHKCTR